MVNGRRDLSLIAHLDLDLNHKGRSDATPVLSLSASLVYRVLLELQV